MNVRFIHTIGKRLFKPEFLSYLYPSKICWSGRRDASQDGLNLPVEIAGACVR